MTIHRPLLRWFDAHQRDLPWRHSRDPYRIWISEVMLQQTTVAAVVPYYHRWLKAFPTVQSLAKAPLSRVLKLWEGLGYYSRARNIHTAAKTIVSDHAGVFPIDVEAAQALPGVGRYILGAVLSQAYEVRLPIVEANSVRVLARLFAYDGDPRKGPWAWQAAETLLPRKRIGDYNQALMELGATDCTPRKPKCEACPLRKQCLAFQRGVQETIPPPKAQPTTLQVKRVALVIRRDGNVLLRLRAGQWEFPDAAESVSRIRKLAVIHHTVTHHAVALTVYESTGEATPELRWVSESRLKRLPMTMPHRRIANLLIDIV